MLYEVMRNVRNFFTAESVNDDFEIKDGTISLPFICRYVLIEGSKFNDGLHQIPLNGLTNEEFKGRITAVNPPEDFLKLVEEIEAYQAKYENTPYVSESFGGYSYQKGTNGKGGVITWEDVFKIRLKVWKKI